MVKRCQWGLCNSDNRYPERLEGGIFFIPFPKPKRSLDKCLRWIKACGRPHEQLNVNVVDGNYHMFVCSKHFPEGKPTDRFPDPEQATPATGQGCTPARPPPKQRSDSEPPTFRKKRKILLELDTSAVDENRQTILSSTSTDSYTHACTIENTSSKRDCESPSSHDSNDSQDSSSQHDERDDNRHMSLEHQVIIKRNFRYLKDELEPEFLLDYFIQEELFTEDQIEEIKAAGCRRNQADLLLRLLLRSRKDSSYSKFLDTLDQIKCSHIRKRLENKDEDMQFDPAGSADRDTESRLQQIRKHRARICSSIDNPTCIAEYFIQFEEFTIDEYELVIHQSTRKLKAEKLLDILLKESHLQRGYDILNYALQDQKDSILKDLDKEEKRQSKEERKSASGGHFSEFQSVDNKETCFSTRFKEANEMSITIDCNSYGGLRKREKEKKMVKKAKKYKVRCDLNNDLVSETECLITKVDQGSIVLRIKGCKKGAIESLFKSPDGAGVSKILQKVFSHPKLSKIFDRRDTFHVTIDILPPPVEKITEKPKNLKQIICKNLDFMSEELDALGFMDLDIFTEEEKADILQSRPKSRSECTKLMLGYICKKHENDIEKFIHEIKQKKRFVWGQICPSESKEYFDDQILSTFYTDIVENLSPFKIMHYCVERDIVDRSVVKRDCFKTRQREECAKMLLLETLNKDYDTRNELLHILKTFDQIPSSIKLTSKADRVHANERITLPGLKYQGTYCFAVSEQMEPPKAVDQDHLNNGEALPMLKLQGNYCAPALEQPEPLNVKNDEDRRDDESGYHSLNSNRRSQALRELESLEESNNEQTLQLGNIPEVETKASDHGAKEHSLIKDDPQAHFKQHPALMPRPMTVPRCLPLVHFDHGIYDITTRPRHSRSALQKDSEGVTEVYDITTRPRHSRSALQKDTEGVTEVYYITIRPRHSRSALQKDSEGLKEVYDITTRPRHSRSALQKDSESVTEVYDITTRPRHSRSAFQKDAEGVTEVSVQLDGENSNTHSGCSRHSLQITDLSQNFS